MYQKKFADFVSLNIILKCYFLLVMVGWIVLEKFSMHDINFKGHIYGFSFDTSFTSLHKTNLNNWTSVNIERIEMWSKLRNDLIMVYTQNFVIWKRFQIEAKILVTYKAVIWYQRCIHFHNMTLQHYKVFVFHFWKMLFFLCR